MRISGGYRRAGSAGGSQLRPRSGRRRPTSAASRQGAGRRARSTPTLEPGRLAVAATLPVGPASGWSAWDDDTRTSRVLVELGDVASHASVHPVGAVIVPSALTVARCTSMVPSVVVVIDGADTAVPDGFDRPVHGVDRLGRVDAGVGGDATGHAAAARQGPGVRGRLRRSGHLDVDRLPHRPGDVLAHRRPAARGGDRGVVVGADGGHQHVTGGRAGRAPDGDARPARGQPVRRRAHHGDPVTARGRRRRRWRSGAP